MAKIDLSNVHLAIFYRNFQARGGGPYKHIGLGVNAMHTMLALQPGVNVTVCGIWDGYDIARELIKMPDITHAIIEAPFIGATDLDRVLLRKFPRVQFICRTHSQISFLQVEAGAIKLIRDYGVLQSRTHNFRLASNNSKLAGIIQDAYDTPCMYLPNLYDLKKGDVIQRQPIGDTLRISSFGAIRLLKNHTGAAAAAMLVARELGTDLEFYINSDREEHGKGVIDALRNMFSGLTWARMVELPWQDWQEFRGTVATMDLCLQPSFTETFCLVMADAASQGVPCVGSPAVSWLPKQFQVNPDDSRAIATAGIKALLSASAGKKAWAALNLHVNAARRLWLAWLSA